MRLQAHPRPARVFGIAATYATAIARGHVQQMRIAADRFRHDDRQVAADDADLARRSLPLMRLREPLR